MSTAYHYTVGKCFQGILSTGHIMQATAGILAWERPVVWFSTNPMFEPTARKWDMTTGRVLSVEECRRRCGGLVRLGMKTQSLIPWPDLARAAGIRRDRRRSLEQVGRRQGANPAHWWGSLEPVTLEDIEVFDVAMDDLNWTSLLEGDAP